MAATPHMGQMADIEPVGPLLHQARTCDHVVGARAARFDVVASADVMRPDAGRHDAQRRLVAGREEVPRAVVEPHALV